MSEYDIHVVREKKKELQQQMKQIIKLGTSKGDNRKKYMRLKQRVNRLNRWIKELENDLQNNQIRSL